jgi:hypothetical protein
MACAPEVLKNVPLFVLLDEEPFSSTAAETPRSSCSARAGACDAPSSQDFHHFVEQFEQFGNFKRFGKTSNPCINSRSSSETSSRMPPTKRIGIPGHIRRREAGSLGAVSSFP